MKKNKPNIYTDIINVLTELKSLYPSYTMGKHISTALDDYGDVWGLSDKELLFAFTKYKAQMEMDVPHETGEDELKQIMDDAMDLDSILKEKEDEYEDY
jgi:hypothetical protein